MMGACRSRPRRICGTSSLRHRPARIRRSTHRTTAPPACAIRPPRPSASTRPKPTPPSSPAPCGATTTSSPPQRPHDRSDRRGRRAAHRRLRPRARHRWSSDPVDARRDLAGERIGPLPPPQRPVARHARSELRRRRPRDHRTRRPLLVHHHPPRRLPVGQPPQRVAAGAHPLLAVRPFVHATTDHPDVLPGRPAVLPGPDLQLHPRPRRPPASPSPATTTT